MSIFLHSLEQQNWFPDMGANVLSHTLQTRVSAKGRNAGFLFNLDPCCVQEYEQYLVSFLSVSFSIKVEEQKEHTLLLVPLFNLLAA